MGISLLTTNCCQL